MHMTAKITPRAISSLFNCSKIPKAAKSSTEPSAIILPSLLSDFIACIPLTKSKLVKNRIKR